MPTSVAGTSTPPKRLRASRTPTSASSATLTPDPPVMTARRVRMFSLCAMEDPVLEVAARAGGTGPRGRTCRLPPVDGVVADVALDLDALAPHLVADRA